MHRGHHLHLRNRFWKWGNNQVHFKHENEINFLTFKSDLRVQLEQVHLETWIILGQLKMNISTDQQATEVLLAERLGMVTAIMVSFCFTKLSVSLQIIILIKPSQLAINTFRSVQTKPGSIFKHSTLPNSSIRNGYYSVSQRNSKSIFMFSLEEVECLTAYLSVMTLLMLFYNKYS